LYAGSYSARQYSACFSIHNPRITIHPTTCASLIKYNILFKNKDDQFRNGG